MNIGVIGGDLRIVRLIEMYAKEGKTIYNYGMEKQELLKLSKNIINCNEMEEVINNSDMIISGMPLTKDGITLNSPFSKNMINLNKLMKNLGGKTFIAGGIPKTFFDNKIDCIDLLENEKLTILNAIPTVEGTIKIAIAEREETIHESNVLVCGFGRIGKILCDRFSKLGANVYCTARREIDFAWIRENRYIPLKYNELDKYAKKMDIVINTVPTLIIKENELNKFHKQVLIIDVASNPGGIDKNYAEKIGIKVITALGIPGKEMPKTAAKYIKEIIDENILNKK